MGGAGGAGVSFTASFRFSRLVPAVDLALGVTGAGEDSFRAGATVLAAGCEDSG